MAPARPIGMIVCTEPLPKERVPSTVARRWSCKRAGDDLGSRGRAAVDQHDHRLAVDQIAGTRAEALHLLGMPAAGGDDLAALQEGVGDEDRLVEQAAGIAAEIEDEALQLVFRQPPPGSSSMARSRPSIVCSLKEAMRI